MTRLITKTIDVEIELDGDVLAEAETDDLIEELENRGYIAVRVDDYSENLDAKVLWERFKAGMAGDTDVRRFVANLAGAIDV